MRTQIASPPAFDLHGSGGSTPGGALREKKSRERRPEGAQASTSIDVARGTPTPVLSLWQPWASAIAVGVKRVETRSWSAPAGMHGTRIAIHAARTRAGLALVDDAMWSDIEDEGRHRFSLSYGVIVATAHLVDCLPTSRLAPALPEQELRWGDYSAGRWAWILDEVERVWPSVVFRGVIGPDVPDDVALHIGHLVRERMQAMPE